MFWSKNKKNRYTPCKPHFFYIKMGFKGVYITWTCYPDVEIDTNLSKKHDIYLFDTITVKHLEKNCLFVCDNVQLAKLSYLKRQKS